MQSEEDHLIPELSICGMNREHRFTIFERKKRLAREESEICIMLNHVTTSEAEIGYHYERNANSKKAQ